ncbi:tetratricopeptide repeat protein [Pseudonocardia sp. RS010]|uniref:tetratricopeptide repeat protein n=1 Tax=Pseudonocardia sp. RS010 TaxID=3385979 RepID=UPI0039A1E8A8
MRRRRPAGLSMERVALPHPVFWGVLTAFLLALAAAVVPGSLLGVLATHSPQWLVTPLKDVTITRAVAAFLLVIALFSLRRTILSRRASRPGPIEITSFDGDDKHVPGIDRILGEFRMRLAEMSLSTPQSIPNEPQHDEIFDNVRTAVNGSTNWVATAAGLLQALFQVRYAYHVSGRLVTREGDQPCGLTLHVVVAPGRSGRVTTFWDDDWMDVAQRGAHWVGAFILPRTRLARRAPWTAWYGLEIPSELFHRTQLARRFMSEKRYEEAIAEFGLALKLDPQNPYLRIELAQCQEQLGLYMDALAGYADCVAIESWFDRRLWLRLRHLLDDDKSGHPPRMFRHSPNGRNALLIARYRLVARLSSASELSDQWHRSLPPQTQPPDVDDGVASRAPGGRLPHNETRAAERQALRTRLSVWLKAYYQRYADEFRPRGAAEKPPLPFEKFAAHPDHMRHFIHFVGVSEVMALVDDYRWTAGRRRPRMPVSQVALRIMEVWAPLQLSFAASRLEIFRSKAFSEQHRRQVTKPGDIERMLQWRLRRKPRWASGWQEHYNAACTLAVALAAKDLDGNDQDQLAMRAVRHLERAISATDSGSVGKFAQWLSTGDEDLRYLRSTEQFIDFLDRYLPNPQLRVRRPHRVLRLIMSRHTILLLERYVALRIALLERSSKEVACTAAEREELLREPAIRKLILRYAEENRDWDTRLKLIREAHRLTTVLGVRSFTAALPPFQEDHAAQQFARRWAATEKHQNDRKHTCRVTDFVPLYFSNVVTWRDRRWPYLAQLLVTLDPADWRRSLLAPDIANALLMWRRVQKELTAMLEHDVTEGGRAELEPCEPELW